MLERHVGKEVATFMKENLPNTSNLSVHYLHSQDVIRSQVLHPKTRKVQTTYFKINFIIIVYNIRINK